MNLKLTQGGALILAMVASVVIVGFAGSAIALAHYSQKYTYLESDRMKARYVAESGLARAVKYMNSSFTKNELTYTAVDNLGNKNLFTREPLNATYDGKTVKIGEYTVQVKVLTPADIVVPAGKDITGNGSNSCRYISVVSTGFVPEGDPKKAKAKVTIRATYEMATSVSHVFDYSYFINNWGWFYGSSITSYGNVRSNGTFSFQSGPTIRSKPRFESSDGTDLIGYIDDNGDGKENNQDGGVYAWDAISGLPNNQWKPDLYAGARGQNTTPYVPQEPMPNLYNFALYEAMSQAQGSYVKIGNTTICDGIWGDNETSQNLYLEGTYENPITIKGTIVVRGNLIIRGYVSGQGVFYSGRNIYIPQRVIYKSGLSEKMPSTNSEASRENWREKNVDMDMLGLFAREHIVLSDMTNDTWKSQVQSYMNNSMNISKEDSGLDLIPNTGDTGENDGKFTIELDPQGNPIPGSGEDIDGDGKYDGQVVQSEFSLTGSNSNFTTGISGWGGNIPTGVTKYSDLTYWNETTDNPGLSSNSSKSQNFPQVDGVLYTNHYIVGYFFNTSYNYQKDGRKHTNNTKMVEFSGSLISRNESLIFSSNGVNFYHDERLTAEDGTRYGLVLPRIWKPLTLVSTAIE